MGITNTEHLSTPQHTTKEAIFKNGELAIKQSIIIANMPKLSTLIQPNPEILSLALQHSDSLLRTFTKSVLKYIVLHAFMVWGF